ncbi:tRNA (N(6)-L-threonylcarbamoyladenosine(37)-C(2))-methylthiotransferase MtaB [Tepidibacter formicigenes]|jgi:threonylcarbamoyladenosine tRNA methylthiotransferase MtaB|uniref:Threonylcarbamoyladenosine tRNA methylthiotransferase MtaB n=1 Tax=Tepidibacter formicigenes DSM 15518 TaxID=1123349 RepID=A0A1M6Q2Y8_9FIRM|nr:tRNA (N(6)-L-threonylcarbamoyladenosine(37)-C(2))-methylthiotransferase MtaB [Tepidibacter formicigenes]SHK14481.1 threonylcarbamoyladenosine tRNA methylthiotransferase MtaB [Tepidibacter formicigenes DSM 15518]
MENKNREKVDLSLDAETFYKKYGRKKTISTFTLGCKVNQYETEAMIELFKKASYEIVDCEEYADVYVINTCTVTNMSDRKSRQFIRRAKKKNPCSIIAVVGCYSQVAPEEILDIEEVNIVMGTNDRNKIVQIIEKVNSNTKLSTVDDIMKVREFEEMQIKEVRGKTRAFLKIQEGCDRFCSYCIIPYARGPVRSRLLDNIVSEVKELSNNGFKEIVLTGIHVASYGKDLGNVNLLDVLKEIHKIEGIKRIRLSSVEPLLMTDDFIKEISSMDKICPHFHLSLQSGCDETLKRMNRKYTTKEYKDIVKKIRENIKNASITTDVIVGFPGETDEEFEKTYRFLEEIELSQMHIFKYSPRKGTPAAVMKNQVDPKIKQVRSEKLISLSKENYVKFASDFIDKTMPVLFEQKLENGYYEGLTPNYIRVLVKEEDIEGKILNVKLKEIKEEFVEGILI